MQFDKLIENPASWMISSPDENDIVLTSRVRLARNLRDTPFPGWATRQNRAEVYAVTSKECKGLPALKNGYVEELANLSQLQKQILVENHLISRDIAARGEGCGVAISANKSLSILLNEEDHLRLQYILPGQQLKKAWTALNKVDDQLEERLPYAYHDKLGYITACPTNLGTGMRASAMLHLPGLVMSGHMEKVAKAAHELNLTVRGIYGEGTQGLGNLFQLSNQATLGETEVEIIDKLRRVINDISVQESNARIKMYRENTLLLADRISRAYGLLKYSLQMSTKEALEYVSILRLGSTLNFFDGNILPQLNELILCIQSAHLQYAAKSSGDTSANNDVTRAEVIRSYFKKISPPNFSNNPRTQ